MCLWFSNGWKSTCKCGLQEIMSLFLASSCFAGCHNCVLSLVKFKRDDYMHILWLAYLWLLSLWLASLWLALPSCAFSGLGFCWWYICARLMGYGYCKDYLGEHFEKNLLFSQKLKIFSENAHCIIKSADYCSFWEQMINFWENYRFSHCVFPVWFPRKLYCAFNLSVSKR